MTLPTRKGPVSRYAIAARDHARTRARLRDDAHTAELARKDKQIADLRAQLIRSRERARAAEARATALSEKQALCGTRTTEFQPAKEDSHP